MKKLTLALVGLLAVLTTWGGPVSREQALSQARSFMASKGVIMSSEQAAFKAPRKGAQSADQVYYYVFNVGQEQGFVVMSGDDRTEPVLGYCDHGSFDAENMPPHMLAFLQGYADEIKQMDDSGAAGSLLTAQKAPRRAKPVMRAISPLVKSRWNQGDPYNRMCPEYYTSDGGHGDHAVTGCVATAIAQIIGYWKHPDAILRQIPSHSNTYTTPSGSKRVELPAIARGTAIDWAHMRDVYTAANTEEEKDAVALLMLMVGQAVKMGYGASSGASHGGNVPDLLKRYFGFDDSAWSAPRNGYSLEDWTNLLYNELAAGRPMSYSGHSTGGGHAFVIDGFDGEGLFHVNWGWGGSCDGYFRITILNPGDNSGIGASTSSDGYSMSQRVTLGVKLPDDVKETELAPASITSQEIVYLSEDGYWSRSQDQTYTKPAIRANYVNWTGFAHSFDMGIGFLKEDGSYKVIGSTEKASLGVNGYRTLNFPVEGLEPGTYKVAPITRQTGASWWSTCFSIKYEWINTVVEEDGTVTLTHVDPYDGLVVEKVDFDGNLKAGDRQQVDVTFRSTQGEYFGTIHLFASQTEEKGSATSLSAIDVLKDTSETNAFFFQPAADATGIWHIWLSPDGDGRRVLYQTDVEITKNGVSSARSNQLSVVSNTVSNKSGTAIYGGIINGTLTLKNNGKEDFDGIVRITLWRDIFDSAPGYYVTNGAVTLHYTIPAGATQGLPYLFVGKETGRTFATSLDNLWANANMQGIIRLGEMKQGVVSYMANGNITGAAPSSNYRTPTNAVAVDLRGISTVKNVRDAGYPNTIYYVDEDAEIEGLEGLNVVRNGHAETISLKDGYSFVIPSSIQADRITLTHTFKKASTGKDNWTTLVLPFEPATITADGNDLRWQKEETTKDLFIKEFASLEDDNTVVFDFPAKLEVNVPYVMAAPEAMLGKEVVFAADNIFLPANADDELKLVSEAYYFMGTWSTVRVTEAYIINADGTAFEPVTRSTNVEGMRAYFVSRLPEGERVERIVICDDLINGITLNPSSKGEGSKNLYNLQGQRIDRPAKGLYIVGGRKVAVK